MNYWLIVVMIFACISAKCQNTITLKNPSFEGKPRYSQLPKGWRNCGFFEQTPPDTQPGSFEVAKPAFDGNTYIGLIVRKDGTWESFGQAIQNHMHAGKCYEFSIHLARSENYLSLSRNSRREKINYTDPVKLRIWGGDDTCERTQLLGETKSVQHHDWKKHEFVFQPEHQISYVIFEVFSPGKILGGANGHLLLDAASAILEIKCGEKNTNRRK